MGFLSRLCQSILILIAALSVGTDARANEWELLRAGFESHCVQCHGGEETNGDVNLADTLANAEVSSPDLELVERIMEALAKKEMPPEDEQQPTSEKRTRWIAILKQILDDGLASQQKLERVPIRRMNRFEYNNAVKDLFELARDPFALPERTVNDISGYFQPASRVMPEQLVAGNRAMGKSQFIGLGNTLPGVAAFPKDNRAEHGFNNRGDHLSLSPVLMESFFELSRSIMRSREFPMHCGVWESLFLPPQGMSIDELRIEGTRRLARFLYRVFRGNIDQATIARYQEHFVRKLDSESSFTDSMQAAISAAMVSPRFLYIYSGRERENAKPTLDDFELASRLSFFLWSSIPDHDLLDLASQGKLSDPTVLAEQANRLMDDSRLKNFCDSFALQWLQLDQMVTAVPDVNRFRDYYFGGINAMIYMVGMHMMIEPLLVFETVLVENRSITELIDSDFTYRSGLLGSWYDESESPKRMEVVGINFHRMSLEDRRWGGVITNAAVLTMTSSPLRTKPITRGAWLVTTIFNDPPEPPPANVPEIEDDDEKLKAEGLTLREKLKQHIINPECAACHQRIDPLGFALENYDAVGRWRDTYRTGLPVDSSGKLFDEHEFRGAVGFKDAILAEKPRFARAFAGHLLSYALGRKLEIGDRPSLDRIVENSAKDDYRFRTMIREVVLSPSFRHFSTTDVEND